MAREIRLFVSCSPDLIVEREVIGRIVASLPITVGWDVHYTPLAGLDADRNAGVAAAMAADIVLVLLGRDFAAPMGAEWNASITDDPVTGGRPPLLPFRKDVPTSPSAQQHLRSSTRAGIRWEEFASPDDLRRLLLPRLAQLLLDRQPYFGLELPEVEGLLAVARSAPPTDRPPEDLDPRRGAGRGGTILGRGNI